MENKVTNVDLHVHSKFSKRPSQWILQKLNCPESFTEPERLYQIARKRGMSLVTITDHNSISGCMEIAHLPGTFISEEVTTYFPEDQCKVHVLVFNIDEGRHKEIQKVRENIFDLAAYLGREGIHHALAHPLFAVNDKLTMSHFEQLILLFKNFELNGSRDERQNQSLRLILSHLQREDIELLSEKHGIEPTLQDPWRKGLTGGSDDHSSLTIARTYSQVQGVHDPAEFLKRLERFEVKVIGRGSTPLNLAHNLYGIAYQFYKNKLGLDRYVSKDLFLRFLDRFLQSPGDEHDGLLSRLHSMWGHRRRSRNAAGLQRSVQELIRLESHALISADPELRSVMQGRGAEIEAVEDKWFRFVNKISNRTLLHFGNHLFDHLSGANLFNIFHTIGSAGGLYTLLAPYFVAFSVFGKQRQLTQEALHRFLQERPQNEDPDTISVAHFTDTFYEINGVATTLQQQVEAAMKTNKKLTVITCDGDNRNDRHGVRNFMPIGVYDLPEYPEQKLFYPPFLEMLDYCYEQGFSHIHSATPGPIGIAALAIARILKLPIYGTYHTALPQYAQALTRDGDIEEMMWKYILWYYDQMDVIMAPSQSTADELVMKGTSVEKIRLFPRGIDIERFHPHWRNGCLKDRYQIDNGIKLLYVGRVSREKSLPILEAAFQTLVQTSRDRVHLVVVGDGPYLREMQENMKGLPCIFTGYLEGDDLASIYASCDLFVFPSTTDTFGNVILEAQASGLPVIVTDSGGPRENMVPGKTGLVAASNDVEGLHIAIRALVSEPKRLKQMGKAARQYMEGRSFERAFQTTWEMYRDAKEGSCEPEAFLAKAV